MLCSQQSVPSYRASRAEAWLAVQATVIAFIAWRVAQWFAELDAESHFAASQHFLEDPASSEKVKVVPRQPYVSLAASKLHNCFADTTLDLL